MKRIHLFEFEDQKWFPTLLRNYTTDFLQFLSNKMKVYEPVVEEINEALRKSNTSTIIDLGSGSGGGLLWLGNELKRNNPELKIILTDFFPNKIAFEQTKKRAPYFDYSLDSVDARNVPQYLTGFRTQFLSFHHFKPQDAMMILQNAVDRKQPIGIFEIQDKTFPSMLAMFLSPLSVLLTTPFIHPFRLGRLIFTYLIPILPLVVLWDGIVSSLRTYSVEELKALVDSIKNKESFDWKIEKKQSKKGFVIYLIAIPKKNI